MEELETTGAETPEENTPVEKAADAEHTEPAGHAVHVESAEPVDSAEPAEPAEPAEFIELAEEASETERASHSVVVMETVMAEDLLPSEARTAVENDEEDSRLRAVVGALVYVAEDPVTVTQIAAALDRPAERIQTILGELTAEYDKPEHGFAIREVAGGYRMTTKPEHHDAVRAFAKSLKPPLKLSLPALETLAVIAYKQPVTAPEIKEIRGVQGTGVLNTLLDRKLIAEAGRKNVIGKPILYKTTKEFMIQFGLKDLSELPTLKEFEEIRRMAFAETEPGEPAPGDTPKAEAPPAEAPVEAQPEATEPVEAPVEAPVEEAASAEGPAEEPPATEPPAGDPPSEEPPVSEPPVEEPQPNPDDRGSAPSET